MSYAIADRYSDPHLPAATPASRQPYIGTQGDPGRSQVIKPPTSLVIMWVLALVTLLFGHYQIAARLNLPYKGLTVLVVLLMPLTPGFVAMLTKRPVVYLLLFEAVLLIGCLTGYTGSPGDLVRVGSQPVVFLRVLPFMLCGYTLALYPKYERWFLGVLLVVFTVISIPDILTISSGALRGLNRDRFLTDRYDAQSATGILVAFVNMSVVGLLMAIAGLRLWDSKGRSTKILMTIPQVILASTSISAGFTAAVVLLFWSIGCAILTAPIRTFRARLLTCVVLLVSVPLGYTGIKFAAESVGGSVAKIYGRLEGLRRSVFDVDGADVNAATSGRTGLAQRSINSFVRSPLIGMGRGSATSDFGGDTETIGGHSYLLDSLGQRGLLGTLPLLLALWGFGVTEWKVWMRERSWRSSSMLTFLLTWVVAIIINPYFLGYLALNSFVFLLFGFILGDGQRAAVAAKPLARWRPVPVSLPVPRIA
jgi:hypothetical protein